MCIYVHVQIYINYKFYFSDGKKMYSLLLCGILFSLLRNCIAVASIVFSDRGCTLGFCFLTQNNWLRFAVLCTKLSRRVWFCGYSPQNYISAALLVNLEIYILYTNPPLISSLSFLWAFIAVLSSSVTSEQKVH